MGFQFQYKDYVFLAAGIVIIMALYLLLLQWKKKARKKMGDPGLIASLTRSYSPQLFFLKFLLVVVALLLGVMTIMNPRKPGQLESINKKGIDIAIALDVSKSMLSEDLAPNRLERARQFIIKMMNQMPNDRVALILFAGKAYLQMPLTADHGAAALFVSSASPDAIPQQGTVIADALEMSEKAFSATEKGFKTIVLISDGEDHDDAAINTARRLAEQGVMINTVGIGSDEGATIPDPATGDVKRDESGNVVVSKLNQQELQDLANASNGIYIKLESSDAAVATLVKQFSSVDRKAFTDVSQLNFKSYFIFFAAVMFVLLVIEIIIPERKKLALA